jgi:hypothetical protein
MAVARSDVQPRIAQIGETYGVQRSTVYTTATGCSGRSGIGLAALRLPASSRLQAQASGCCCCCSVCRRGSQPTSHFRKRKPLTVCYPLSTASPPNRPTEPVNRTRADAVPSGTTSRCGCVTFNRTSVASGPRSTASTSERRRGV